MTVTGVAGIGTQLRRWNANASPSGAWEKLTKITAIDWTGMKRETQDTTDLDVADGYKTFIPGLRESGVLKLSVKFDRDVYELMKDDFESDELKHYEIVLPDTDITSFEFMGFVIELPFKVDTKLITADVSIQISGKMTMNSGSGPSPA